MNSKKIFEQITGLKPNNEILNIMDNLNYGYNFEKRLEELINLRENYYKLAHLNVDVNKNMITQITKDIIYKIEKFRND